jgi:hypothetical protein
MAAAVFYEVIKRRRWSLGPGDTVFLTWFPSSYAFVLRSASSIHHPSSSSILLRPLLAPSSPPPLGLQRREEADILDGHVLSDPH